MNEEVNSWSNQYLTFRLGEEIFALEIGKVREVLDFTGTTKVPRTPPYMRGVINLRGGVVPVIDMNLKFNLAATEQTVNTCIIIVEIKVDDETTVVGALADSVEEVLELEPDQIEPAPRIGTRLDTRFIKGMGKHDERFIIILDIDRVFSAEELAEIGEHGNRGSAAGFNSRANLDPPAASQIPAEQESQAT